MEGDLLCLFVPKEKARAAREEKVGGGGGGSVASVDADWNMPVVAVFRG